MSATDTLRMLEASAMELEAQHRYDSVDRRTVRYEVDTARTSSQRAYGRLVLLVVAAYPQWFEQQAFFGHQGPGRRADVKPHLVYVAEYEGIPLPLRRRSQALLMLITGKLPGEVPIPTRPPEPSLEGIDDLFEEIHRIATRGKY